MSNFSAKILILRTNLLATAATSLLILGGCGGGSNSSSGTAGVNSMPTTVAPTTGTTGGSTTGDVAVMFTDGPTSAFCRILATVERIDLLGPSGSTNVFTGPVTVDLLRLRNYTDLFSARTNVPIGTYSKVRLTLSDLALVQCDSAGNPEPASSWEHPHLPGNGKLDLNPRSTFEVVGGETLMIRLDMDMGKSLFLHQTGNGKWQFRPVIFCDTIRPARDKLVRVFGAAGIVNGMQFQLCPLRPAASTDSGSTKPAPGTECLTVYTDGKTGTFDQAGNPVGSSAIATGDLLTAIGFLSLYDNADSDTLRNNLRLDAAVVELGNRDTFKRIVGQVVSAPGNNDLFVFEPTLVPTPLNSTAPTIDVRLQSGTRIFALGSNQELTAVALQPGTFGQVDGVFTDPANSVDPLKSSLIVLAQNTTPAVSLLDAVIESPIPPDDDTVAATRRFTVDNVANPNGACVKTDVGTRYLLITETATSSDTTEITFADLMAGDKVDVYGANDATEPACVLADTIQKYAP